MALMAFDITIMIESWLGVNFSNQVCNFLEVVESFEKEIWWL
jgi:hypothetical protein